MRRIIVKVEQFRLYISECFQHCSIHGKGFVLRFEVTIWVTVSLDKF